MTLTTLTEIKAYFVSDLHLGSKEEPKFFLFLNWLKKLNQEKPTHLFLVGDIFDLWIGDYDYFKEKFSEIIYELIKLSQSGVEVHYFEGNHDLYLNTYWQNKLGFKVHNSAEQFLLGSIKVRVEHGDEVNREDHGYLFLRWFLRTPLMKLLAHYLPEKWIVLLGEKASQKSRTYTTTVKKISREEILNKLRWHTIKKYNEKEFDVIVSGHIHEFEDVTIAIENKSVRSINLGTWLDKPRVAVLIGKNLSVIEL